MGRQTCMQSAAGLLGLEGVAFWWLRRVGNLSLGLRGSGVSGQELLGGDRHANECVWPIGLSGRVLGPT